jgi:hypothetical protein
MYLGLPFHYGMTAKIIHTWSSSLKKQDREKSVRDTSHFLEKSNRLCRPVAVVFLSS